MSTEKFLCLLIVPLVSSLDRVCYYPYSGKSGNVLTPDRINVTLCTHIIFGFANVNNSELVPRNRRDIEGYRLVTALKTKKPELKILLSSGGADYDGFPLMASSLKNRNKFVNRSVSFLRKYSFDGLDLDWEFPAVFPSPPENRRNFADLLSELRDAFERESLETGRKRLLLSAAVAATEPLMTISYDIPKVGKSVDFLNIMCYDYHGYARAFPFTGHNSPLFARRIEKGYFASINIEWSAKAWHAKGVPKNKILIGLPTYGHTFRLLDENKKGIGAPSVGYTFGSSEVPYVTICKFLDGGATRVVDDEIKAPYAYKGLNWVGYDDVQSITVKSKWIKENGFRGVMTWCLNDDDWAGKCQPNITFPLHTAIYNVLN